MGIMGQSSFQTNSTQTNSTKLEKALASMQEALALLDDADVAHDIGAYLDLAICRLTNEMSPPAEIGGMNKIPLPRI